MNKLTGMVTAFLIIIFTYSRIDALSIESDRFQTRQTVMLHMGKQGVKDFYIASGDGFDEQPAGMSFSFLRWQPSQLGEVTIEHAKNKIVIPHVFLVTGVVSNKNEEGVFKIEIDSGLNQNEFVSQEEAYQAYRKKIKQINNTGWRHYYEPYDARIAKEDNLRFILETNRATESAIPLNFKEWKQVLNDNYKDIYYKFYLDGVTMDLLFRRIDTNEQGKVQIMSTARFATVRYDTKNIIPRGYKVKGDTLYDGYQVPMEKNKEERQNSELEMMKKGYRIDRNYQDPDFWQYTK